MIKNPLISVIIVNWNTSKYLKTCIEYLEKQTEKYFELIIIDNNSNDNLFEILKGMNLKYVLVQNRENYGYAKGANQGIKLSKGKYILLLNPDAYLKENYLQYAVNLISRNPDVGMIGGKIFKLKNNCESNEIDQTGNYLRKRISVIWDENLNSEQLVFGPNGCCSLLRKEMLDDIVSENGEYFDEIYFCYWEDIDLFFRAQLKGWKCLYSNKLVGYHARSGSLKEAVKLISKPTFYQRIVLRNRILTIIKDFPLPLILYLFPYLVLAEILIWPYFIIKRTPNVLNLLTVYIDVIKLFPDTIRKRMFIQKTRKVSIKYLKKFFIKF